MPADQAIRSRIANLLAEDDEVKQDILTAKWREDRIPELSSVTLTIGLVYLLRDPAANVSVLL